MPEGKSLLLLSTESGEVEFWKAAANGTGAEERLTNDGSVLRWEGVPSPDGKWIAHQDKDAQLWLLDTASKTHKRIATSPGTSNAGPQFDGLCWSPDSRWLAFAEEAPNQLLRIMLYSVESGSMTPMTTDRYLSYSPVWSPDGKWIYFISDRALHTQVFAPWGARQPEPYF